MMPITLSQIFIYPVKSLAGICVSTAAVTKTGLLYDRQWMLIDAENQFLSQRRLPRMALIHTALTETELILSAAGVENIAISLNPKSSDETVVQIWHDTCVAQPISNEVDIWLSDFLKTPCRLVYQPQQSIRTVDPHYANPNDQVSFADAFPFLIISNASLLALNQAMNLDLSMTRFRPNLVISGCESYAEDYWREIQIGTISFRLPKPCSRCNVPTIDPLTANMGKEPLATLNRLRKWQNKIYFGQNALHNNEGILNVGDAVIIQQSGEAQPPLSKY